MIQKGSNFRYLENFNCLPNDLCFGKNILIIIIIFNGIYLPFNIQNSDPIGFHTNIYAINLKNVVLPFLPNYDRIRF